MRFAIYADFDGTITTRDSLVTLIDAFVPLERRERDNQLLLSGERPLWELLDSSLRACGVPLETAIAYLHRHVELDPHFGAFDAWCRTRGVPLEVVSAGVFEIVESFLGRSGLVLPIRANRAAPGPGCFGLTPENAECPTGVDKGGVVRAGRESGLYTVFVGDGISDRLAVPEADLVYAKSGLARYCTQRGVPFVPFETFRDVQQDLAGRLGVTAD
ncbi:2-hydroxy-3-keto-5-methylthiopentenyl-1-phosphate phosphatase [compost metagenome]